MFPSDMHVALSQPFPVSFPLACVILLHSTYYLTLYFRFVCLLWMFFALDAHQNYLRSYQKSQIIAHTRITWAVLYIYIYESLGAVGAGKCLRHRKLKMLYSQSWEPLYIYFCLFVFFLLSVDHKFNKSKAVSILFIALFIALRIVPGTQQAFNKYLFIT